jgi:hypothetical protein
MAVSPSRWTLEDAFRGDISQIVTRVGYTDHDSRREFSQRAHRYHCLDERLAAHTRFFAAAALTNRVLAELCTYPARWVLISQTTINALITIGEMLEALNLVRASRIQQERVPPQEVDKSLIEMEQSCVEIVLRSWAAHRTVQHRQIVSELDQLLRAVTRGFLPVHGSRNVHKYVQILRLVTRSLGRYPSFTVRDHRVKIGLALVEAAKHPHG